MDSFSYLQNCKALGPLLLVTPWYRPGIGGIVEVADRLLRTFTNKGLETHLLVCEDKKLPAGKITRQVGPSNVWPHEIASYVFYRLSLKAIVATLVFAPVTLYRILELIRTQRIRTVILIYPTAYAWPFLLLRYAAHIRLIVSYHGNDLLAYDKQTAVVRWLIRRLIRNADGITVPAEHLAQKIRELCPDRHVPVELIHNCIDVKHFMRKEAPSERVNAELIILHISNFTPKKRTTDIIEAFADATLPPNCRLLMVGDGVAHGAAVEYASRLGISHRVEFVGAQPDVRPFLWRASLLIMASDEESGPLALLEAMACEVPWIATRWGIATMIPEGECGIIVPCRSPELLAKAMMALINDPKRRDIMGRNGRARVLADFGEEEYAERHLQLISEVENDNLSS